MNRYKKLLRKPKPKYPNGGSSENGEETIEEMLERERREKQRIADDLFNFGSDPSKVDSVLDPMTNPNARRITRDDPEFKEYWDPTSRVGLERQVMEAYSPDEILVNSEREGYSFPIFKQRYVVPSEESSKEIGELSPKAFDSIKEEPVGDIQVSSPTPGLLKYTNPYTNQSEPMTSDQQIMLQRSQYKGEEQPEFDRNFRDRISGPADPNSVLKYKLINPDEYPEEQANAEAQVEMYSNLFSSNKSAMSNIVEKKYGGEMKNKKYPNGGESQDPPPNKSYRDLFYMEPSDRLNTNNQGVPNLSQEQSEMNSFYDLVDKIMSDNGSLSRGEAINMAIGMSKPKEQPKPKKVNPLVVPLRMLSNSVTMENG
jgi:hypothetical protein